MARATFLTAAAQIFLLCLPLAAAWGDASAGQGEAIPVSNARPSGIVIPAPTGRPTRSFDQTSILVRFKPATLNNRRAAARAQINGTRLRAYSIISGLEHIRLGAGRDVEQALATLRRLPFVAYAHRNHVIYLDQQPNDAYFDEQWALHNTGQGSGWDIWFPGTPDANIDWPEAWANATGNGSVVAILDTGIDYRHSDLGPNVWQNAAEVSGIPGVDDDGNGYVDDFRGWDFVNGDNNPLDGHGHGTHVAGTVAALVNNSTGVAGVMWNGQVMALKILDDQGFGLLSDAIAALQYAIDQGVRVSNNSWGYSALGPGNFADHQALYDAIEAAAAADHLFVAAAGNDTVDTDSTPHYPSAFDLDNIISVAATDNNDQLAWFSSWGPVSVDLAAPGQDVFSTYKLFAGRFDDYAWISGTSMATPHVSGVAGLVAGMPQCQTYQQVREQILNNVRPLGALSGLMVTGGVLSTNNTMDGNECPPPAPPLTVVTTTLFDARVGFGYGAHLTAGGGMPPYAWLVIGGSLPSGLELSYGSWIIGTVRGSSGTYEFVVRVTDDAGTTATRVLSITVKSRLSRCSTCHAVEGF